jgi:threonine aldolase
MARYDFASDNTCGMAPEALAALAEFNDGYVAGYGADPVTARAGDALRALLDADVEVRFVYSGTAANALTLSWLARPHEAVLAHENAHIVDDEVGAPEAFGGGMKIARLPGPSGKIDPAALQRALDAPQQSRFHSLAALSLTNATEYGTVYTADEVAALTGPARARGLKTQMDGARLASAAAGRFDLKRAKDLGLDILVMGGTKSGMLTSEAVVFFDKTLVRGFDTRTKQVGQLPSKVRFLSAPWVGMLESGAWLSRAAHANAMAQKLAAEAPFEPAHPVEANGVFLKMPAEVLGRLNAAGWAIYPYVDGSARLLCSWATTEEQVEEVVAAMKAAV